ncbi:MAG TPA: hypothetical protein VHI52_04150, partial [Verrucomicrobiae bacterium]|nr:hypothetical protein [Verrucomicrobiae bacterium]
MIVRRLPKPNPRLAGALLRRVHQSAVGWSWIYNALRLASGFILLPLVLTKLGKPELGMYYVLLSLAALVPLVDFGFGPTIGRFVTYAMGGAESIQAHGVARPGTSAAPNYRLLWELLFTTRVLYRYLTLALLVVLGAWGTYVVELRIHETASPFLTRLAWAATLVTAMMDIYANWWITYLRSMNEVVAAVRIGVFGWGLRLVIAAVLFVAGAGLLSLPAGSFFGSVAHRFLARRRVLRLLAGHPAPTSPAVREMLVILWPNTWRLGLQFISGYLTVNANTALCLYFLGLSANASYGLSVQLLAFVSGMASVWVNVKWPLIGQCRARHDLAGVQRILWPRFWLQTLTFLSGCACVLGAGPFLLHWFGGGKQILPIHWLLPLMISSFFEMQFTLWGTLLSTENRLPYLWPTVATNVLSLILSFSLIRFTSLGLGALVLGPLIAGLLFNYWFWPPYTAR